MDQKDAIKASLIAVPATLGRSPPRVEPLLSPPPPDDDELAQFFAQSHDLLCIAGFDGYFKRLNPAWTTQLGWTLEELNTRPILDFVHRDDRAATGAEIAATAQGKDTTLFEHRFLHRNGSYRWLSWNVRPVPDRGRIYAAARDITVQMRLESEIIAIADREKERMGRELHDGLCQTLAGIAALSATLSRRLAAHADPAASAAAEIAKLLNDAISQARDLARGLVPLGLNEASLEEALQTLACNVQHLFHVSCTLACDHPVAPLRPEVAVHLFRITQEAVHNAVAHGRANQIEITLSCQDGQGLLSVRDTGVGLCVKASQGKGIGLHTMAYRARMIGGTLEVLTPPRGGTRVLCAFPLPASPDASEAPDHARDPT